MKRASLEFATVMYRGQPMTDGAGKPTGKRKPIRERARTILRTVMEEERTRMGRALTKAERKAVKRKVGNYLAKTPGA